MARQTPETMEAREVVAEKLRRLARAQARLDALTVELERELQEVRRRHEGAIARLQRRVDRSLAELEEYCRAERDALLPAGRKTLTTPFGEVRFRKAEPSLVLNDGVEESEVCEALRKLRLDELVRVRESLDRHALRKAVEDGRVDPAQLRPIGLSLVEREDLFGCKLRRDTLVAVGGPAA